MLRCSAVPRCAAISAERPSDRFLAGLWGCLCRCSCCGEAVGDTGDACRQCLMKNACVPPFPPNQEQSSREIRDGYSGRAIYGDGFTERGRRHGLCRGRGVVGAPAQIWPQGWLDSMWLGAGEMAMAAAFDLLPGRSPPRHTRRRHSPCRGFQLFSQILLAAATPPSRRSCSSRRSL